MLLRNINEGVWVTLVESDFMCNANFNIKFYEVIKILTSHIAVLRFFQPT